MVSQHGLSHPPDVPATPHSMPPPCPATSPYPSDKASTSAPGPESTRGSCVTGSCIATEQRKTEQVTAPDVPAATHWIGLGRRWGRSLDRSRTSLGSGEGSGTSLGSGKGAGTSLGSGEGAGTSLGSGGGGGTSLCHRFLHCNRAEEDRTGHCVCWSLVKDSEPAWPLPSA